MTRAEQRALEAYPVKMIPLVYQDLSDRFGGKTEIDVNTYPRCLFQEGYEQAEKDIRSEKIEDALLMETGIAARLSVLRGLAIKKGNDGLAEKIGDEIDYIYGLYSSADGGINPDASGVCWTVKRSPIFTEKKEEIE